MFVAACAGLFAGRVFWREKKSGYDRETLDAMLAEHRGQFETALAAISAAAVAIAVTVTIPVVIRISIGISVGFGVGLSLSLNVLFDVS
jgi:hypothetical protein